MKNKNILVFLSIFILLLSFSGSFAQDPVEGYFSVGKTGCTIEFNYTDKNYHVYWNEGTGYTFLYFKDELPNGNYVYEEYETNGTTYTGRFIFKNRNCTRGVYERSDGKDFTVRKEY